MSHLALDINPRTSCGYHRMALPFAHLQCTPSVPVFVFNRVPSGGMAEIARKRAEGYRIVADIDDYWVLHDSHYLHHHFTHGGVGRAIAASLAQADVVMVTHHALADQVRVLNPNIAIVPNALPYGQGQFVPGKRAGKSLFVYAAGPSHYGDVHGLRDALNVPDLTLAGVQDNHPEWRRMRQSVPKAQVARELPVDSYMHAYEGHAVALAPLADNLFNRCKSNLKALEAGAMGMPLIASRVHPYDNPLDRDVVLYAQSSADWQWQMDRCRSDPAFVADAGARLAEHVRRNYSLAVANETRRQVIEGMR